MGPVTWHCHTVIIIEVCIGGVGWLNDGFHRWWWLVKVVTQRVMMKVVVEKGNICLLITCL